MGKNRFTKAKEILNNLKREKGQKVSFNDLKLSIMRDAGSDLNRTVKPYISLMIDQALIRTDGSDWLIIHEEEEIDRVLNDLGSLQ
jgi:hypothetical protein